jgi:hypothetical protein
VVFAVGPQDPPRSSLGAAGYFSQGATWCNLVHPGHGEKLTRKQEQAIAALLSEVTIERAAAKIGVACRTLKNWLKRPDFAASYRAARRAVTDESILVLQKSSLSAAIALNRNLDCGNPGVEVRAALGLFAVVQKADELNDLANQLAELRQQVEQLFHDRRTATRDRTAHPAGNGFTAP